MDQKNGNMRGQDRIVPVPLCFLDLNVLLVKDVCLRVLVHLHKEAHWKMRRKAMKNTGFDKALFKNAVILM